MNEAKALPTTIFGFPSLGVEVKGHELVHFSFHGQEVRDSYVKRINSAREQISKPPHGARADSPPSSEFDQSSYASESRIPPSSDSGSEISSTKKSSTHDPLVCNKFATQTLAPLSSVLATAKSQELSRDMLAHIPKAINVPRNMLPLKRSRHFVCLTIGSRGDVQ